jgi:hypothetical protein
MKVRIGAVLLAGALAFSVPADAQTTGVAQAKPKAAEKSSATEFSAPRANRGYVYRPAKPPYYPTYYARPTTYRPYPYGVPAPFFLGFAYLPFW